MERRKAFLILLLTMDSSPAIHVGLTRKESSCELALDRANRFGAFTFCHSVSLLAKILSTISRMEDESLSLLLEWVLPDAMPRYWYLSSHCRTGMSSSPHKGEKGYT